MTDAEEIARLKKYGQPIMAAWLELERDWGGFSEAAAGVARLMFFLGATACHHQMEESFDGEDMGELSPLLMLAIHHHELAEFMKAARDRGEPVTPPEGSA